MEIFGLLDVPLWLLGIVSFIVTVYIYTRYKQTTFTRNGIYQKPPTFLFGDLGAFAKHGAGYLNSDLVKEHGKIFGSYFGNIPTLNIADTDIIKEIMVKQFSNFTDRWQIGSSNKESVWDSAITSAKGEHWRFLRSTLSPSFTSGKMRYMTTFINKCLDNLTEILEEKRQEQGEGFDIGPILRGYTMDAICSTGFGMDVNSQRNPDNPFIKHAKMIVEQNFTGNPLVLFALFFPDLPSILLPSNQRMFAREPFDFFKAATESAIKERQKDNTQHRDLLQLMINSNLKGDKDDINEKDSNDVVLNETERRGLTDTEVAMNSMLFMLAGYDTTATTLEWLVYDLVLHPEVQDKLFEEIESEIGQDRPNYDTAFKLKYMDMVVNETLRMHPAASATNRTALEDVEIHGVKIQKDWMVTLPILALHYMPEYWEEPTKYNPERFSPENQKNISQFAYAPFGLGPRNCVGMRLALLEIKMTVITLLQKYELVKSADLAVPMPLSKKGTSLKAEKPLLVKLKPR